MARDPSSHTTPAYKVIAGELRQAILQNRYPQGHRLPTEEELAESHNLGRQTIRRAFQELSSEGLIYRVRRRGTFAYPVTAPLSNAFGHVTDVVDLSSDDETEVIEPLHDVEVDEHMVEMLQLEGPLAKGMTILRVKQSMPLYFAHLRFPSEIAEYLGKEPVLGEKGHRGRFTIIGLIDLHRPDTVVNLVQTIEAVDASEEVATHLGCARGAPLLRVERIYYDRFGAPMELATTYYHPKNYTMRMRLRR